MKKILLLILLLLVGCEEKTYLNGTYTSKLLNSETFYEFDEDQVKVKLIVSGIVLVNETGKYVINEEENEITFKFPDLNNADALVNDKKLEGTFTFEQKEDSIKIGMIEFNLK